MDVDEIGGEADSEEEFDEFSNEENKVESSEKSNSDSDLSCDTDVISDEDENTIEEETETNFITSPFNYKTQRTEIQPKRGKVWYAQCKPNEKVIWKHCDEPNKSECSLCYAKVLQTHQRWHVFAQNSGEKCNGCNFVFFLLL